MLDETAKPLDANISDTDKQLYLEYYDVILEAYQKAYDMWGIGNNLRSE